MRLLLEVKNNECAATGGEGFYFNNTSVDDGAELDCDARPRT